MSNIIVDITDNSFEDNILQHKGITLVEFWAPWCIHCQHMMPIVESIAQEYQSQIRIARVNIDDNQTISQAFEIEGTPTFILFKNGQVVDEKIGEVSKDTLIHFIEDNL